MSRYNYDNYDKFKQKFNLKTLDSTLSSRRYEDYINTNSIDNYGYIAQVRHQEMVSMELPREDFDRLVDQTNNWERLIGEELTEHAYREKYPAVKSAYDQYRMLLNLMKG